MYLLLTNVILLTIASNAFSLELSGLSNPNQGVPIPNVATWTSNSNLFSNIQRNNENMQMQHSTLAANGLAPFQHLLQVPSPILTMMDQGKPVTIPKLHNVPLQFQQLASTFMNPTGHSILIPFFVAVNSNEDDNDDVAPAPASNPEDMIKPFLKDPNHENVANKTDKGVPDSESDEEDEDESAYYD